MSSLLRGSASLHEAADLTPKGRMGHLFLLASPSCCI